LSSAGQPASDALFELRGVEVPTPAGDGPTAEIAVLGSGATPGDGLEVPVYEDLEALERAVADGAPVPEAGLAQSSPPPANGQLAEAAHALTEGALALAQAWLASESLGDSRLVLLTKRAVAVKDDEPDLVLAGLPGLLRSAHSEHPDRFGLVDVDGSEESR